ncbi:saccharopine dehydrogenase NADP-binding domain-containing protein [Pseudoalteromonas sp. SMS1]|uniref:saccharopine dehydrogenase NADP-binding domain-containing protein n=1 Tax=Pseudoalteromonas sp. SMS1 TaxID=2908894 RepID=UPI001F25128A|nr:saccharopine dehydrogenase NADP-binding domain-containing protein [Pseudoalteromonas sp. SMS1]MCF2857724.1 saccharopine dehydrogenase NADP-binding domain-containing protein [Pseudoalteromonas sp. SMS1]
MQSQSVLLLGGTGQVGLKAAEYLLQHTEATLTFASRRKASLPSAILQYQDRINTVQLDAQNTDALRAHLAGIDLVVACVGPSGIIGDQIVLTCKAANVPIIDAGGYDPVYESLHAHERRQTSEVPLIINVGLLPGLSGVFPAYLIQQKSDGKSVKSLDVQYVGRDAWSYNSAWDIIHGLGDFGHERGFCYLEDKQIKSEKFSKAGNKAHFPAPIGSASTMLIYAEEIVQLANELGIQRAKVYGANLGPRAMFVCMIAKIFKMYNSHKSIARAARWLCKASAKDMRKLDPVYGVDAKIECIDGSIQHGQIILEDTYQATGFIIGIAAKQLLNNQITKVGPMMLHEAVDAGDFIKDLAQAGVVAGLSLSKSDKTAKQEAA